MWNTEVCQAVCEACDGLEDKYEYMWSCSGLINNTSCLTNNILMLLLEYFQDNNFSIADIFFSTKICIKRELIQPEDRNMSSV